MENRAARRVPGYERDAWRSRHVERGSVAVGGHRTKVVAAGSVTHRPPQEPQQRQRPHRSALPGGVGHLATGQRRVQVVDSDRPATFGSAALREADMVAMAVGQHDRPNVVEGPTHRGQFSGKIVPKAGQARIHDRDLAAIFDQIGVDDARAADASDPRCYLHRPSRLQVLRALRRNGGGSPTLTTRPAEPRLPWGATTRRNGVANPVWLVSKGERSQP